MKVREQRQDLAKRVRLLAGLTGVFLVVIATAFWSVQIVHGGYYRDLAESNRLRKVSVRAPRGQIYDRAGHLLVENVPSYDLLIDRSRSDDLDDSIRFATQILDVSEEDLRQNLGRFRAVPAFSPVRLFADLTLGEVARFEVKRLEHPEFEIDVRHLRLYRHGPQTSHVLGYLGEVSQAEIAASGGEYEPGELVGKEGVEKSYDRHLRGSDGQRVVVVDSRGRVLDEYQQRQAAAGRPLHLSLDLELQQKAEQLMQDKVGAVVALDARTGEIRALYSAPPYNPNLLARGVSTDEWHAILEHPYHPLQNRAIQSTYSPGSVFKVVIAAAGLAEGVIDPSTTVHCGGVTTIYNHRFRCWKRGGHGRVNLVQALKGSCDIYFYNVGKALGIDRIARYARLFGLGEATGVELAVEKSGLVPDPQWSLARRKHPWYPGETISVSIGQGPLLVTPLQVATMMAAVANGGRTVGPHLRAGHTGPRGTLQLPEGTLDPIRRGLWEVVNSSDGTARGSAVPGLEIAGKTGTVQVVSQSTWTKNEDLPFDQRDHAWFASFAPADDPELVVVVFIEHGGSGSRAAAPMAKALYEEYFGIHPGRPS